jgi:hypothetical protein
MNNSGDAAEQMVRMSLDGVEVAAKVTGTAAKEIAIMLIAALKNKNSSLKLRGKARLNSMLKSGKALEIFSVKERDLKNFVAGAKEYGVVYCVLRKGKHAPDGLCDIMVKADDAPKINRVVENFKFATVDNAKIESEIVAAKTKEKASTEPGAPEIDDNEKLLDDLLGTKEGKAKPEAAKAEPEKAPVNPDVAKTAKTRPSEPTFENKNKSARGTSSKPSVKEELRDINAARKEKDADAPKRNEREMAEKPKSNSTTQHKQPPTSKSKSYKSKVR